MESCPNCDAKTPAEATFCPSCGFALGSVASDDASEPSRIRRLLTPWLLAIGLGVGFSIGAYLGQLTERTVGLLAVVGAIGGAGVGLYLAQIFSMRYRDDDEAD